MVFCYKNTINFSIFRNVTSHKGLPSHLKPDAINTHVGLRTRVVRALYHIYKPFRMELLHHVPLMSTPCIEENLMVECHWWKRLVSTKHDVWRLFIKLVKVGGSSNNNNKTGRNSTTVHRSENYNRRPSIFSVTQPLTYNPEENNRLLHVTASSYVHVPNVFGMCLTEVGTSVSRDMKCHKAKLYFHEYRANRKYHSSQATILTVDPVIDVQLLNLWNPDYPHPIDT